MRIALLVLDGVFDTGLTVVMDTLAVAAELAPPRTRFEVTRIGVRRRVTTGLQLRVPVDPVPSAPPDLVIVPALACKTPQTLDAALERRDVREAAALLRTWRGQRVRVAAACTGTFVLAASGILDGRAATTTWWLAAAFRERYRKVDLDESRMIVDARGVTTAGAALAHLDLALHIIRRRSPTLARTTARYLTFEGRPSQAAFVMPDHIAHSDPLVERFEKWARRNLDGFTVGAAARATGASERTLERRVRRALGRSPLSFVQDLRVEDARYQLETTDRSLDEIAARVGYRDGATLRTLLREKTGLGVRELRGRA